MEDNQSDSSLYKENLVKVDKKKSWEFSILV